MVEENMVDLLSLDMPYMKIPEINFDEWLKASIDPIELTGRLDGNTEKLRANRGNYSIPYEKP